MDLRSEQYWSVFVPAGAAVQGETRALSARIVQAHRAGRGALVCGNGGSATAASHLACDLAWGRRGPGRYGVHAFSLNDQLALLSALENDMPHAEALAWMVGCYGRPGDVLIAISASGNSANVVRAAEAARGIGMPVLALVGFDGGRLREVADAAIWVPAHDFGIVEDVHALLCHTIAREVSEALADPAPDART